MERNSLCFLIERACGHLAEDSFEEVFRIDHGHNDKSTIAGVNPERLADRGNRSFDSAPEMYAR
jgi:hypothetical protein